MASSYSSNLKIELITTGEQPGAWGETTNDNFTNVFEQSIVGRGNPVFLTDTDLTLTYTDSVSVQTVRSVYLNVTSSTSLTATRSLIVPTIYKNYIVENNTTGGQSITVKTSAGTGVTIPNGSKAPVYVDAVNVVPAFNYLGGNIQTGGTFQVAGSLTANSISSTNSVLDPYGNVRNIPTQSKTSAYVLASTDNGRIISITTGGVTLNSGIFAAGNTVVIYNNSSSSQTITVAGEVTMILALLGSTGSRTLSSYGLCTIICLSNNSYVISGTGVS